MHILQSIIKSFYSKEFYREVLKSWKGVGFVYLLIIITIISIPFIYNTCFATKVFFGSYMENFVDQVPEIIVRTDGISISETMPYYFRDSDQKVIGLIDTTGGTKSLDEVDGAFFLLTKNKIMVKEKANQYKTYNLKEFTEIAEEEGELTLTKEMVSGFYEGARRWVPIVLYPFIAVFIVLFTLLGRMLQALVYTLFGMLFSGLLKVKLNYGDLYRLTIVALVPTIILGIVFDLASFDIPFRGFWFFVLGMGYLFFAIKANVEKA